MQMLTKFESKSSRVKGIAFHPKRPWILSSLHNGTIQLWDYRMGTLLEKFEDHEGPVRGIAFHPSNDLFVSGGDDYKVRVWNLKTRKCIFALEGHMDYVRTVSFHAEQPWIISASDDQTIRIWNWQSRQCIAVLSGHNHYVMSAQFHPTDDLVVSACLDQTVRVWDISGLRKKSAAGAPLNSLGPQSGKASSQEYFIQVDVAVKFVLEGHTRGVNWAAFHPTRPLILSCGDDRQIKIWRMSETKAWEVESLRGHYNNVSTALFHPQRDFIVSCSEDKTIRVWETNKHSLIQTFKRETDRFWCIAMHPEQNLLAAGHDTGFIVFKLERERSAFDVHANSLVYVRNDNVRLFDINSSADIPLINFKPSSGQYFVPPHTLSFNHAEKAVLLSSPADGGSYDLHMLPKEITGQAAQQSYGLKGSGICAVWLGRNRFAVLEASSQEIHIKDMQNTTTKSLQLPFPVKYIFSGPGSNLILSTSSNCVLYDTQTKTFSKEVSASSVKYVAWSPDMSSVALLSKHSITIADRNFETVSTTHETLRIKSAVWDNSDVLLYSTLSHLKFMLRQGDSGAVRTLDAPIYLTGIRGKTVYFVDRDAKPQKLVIDPTEYLFKLALLNKNYNDVVSIIRSSSLVGQSIISYIKQKGYPEVALHFVKESSARFELAIECGNMEIALETAKTIDKPVYWTKLAEEALKLGFINIVELAYQRSKAHDKLANLLVLAGQFNKISKVSISQEAKSHASSKFNNTLLTCSIEERIKILLESGQYSLAYLTAKSHGFDERAQMILKKDKNSPESITGVIENPVLLAPPIPAARTTDNLDWPHLSVSKGIFDTKFAAGLLGSGENKDSAVPGARSGAGLAMTYDETEEQDVGGDWDEFGGESISGPNDTFSNQFDQGGILQTNDSLVGADDAGWGMDDDLDLGTEIAAQATAAAAADYVPPQPGVSHMGTYARSSRLAVDFVTAGNFEEAMNFLNKQIGVVNFEPLKQIFLQVNATAHSLLAASPNAPILRPLIKTDSTNLDPFGQGNRSIPPARVITLNGLISMLQIAYKTTTAGKFTEAIEIFKHVIHRIPFLVLGKKSEMDEAKQMIFICREYILGLSIERTRRELSSGAIGSNANTPVGTPNPENGLESQKRQLELASYFTHCQIQPIHEQLSLRSAMSLAYKYKNYKTSGLFAKRLLDLAPPAKVVQLSSQILTISNQQSRNAFEVEYDPLNPFKICAKSHTPIYLGSESAECAYCHASYTLRYVNDVCEVCMLSQIRPVENQGNKNETTYSVAFS